MSPSLVASISEGLGETVDGQRFLINQEFGIYRSVYVNDRGVARFIGTVPYDADGWGIAAALATGRELYAEAGTLPAYEWPMLAARAWDCRLVPNVGTVSGDPRLVINAGGGLVLDNDGSHTSNTRVVGDEEVTVTFTASTQHITILYRVDLDTDHPATDLVVSAKFKGSGKLVIGSSSTSVGEKTLFDATSEWVTRSVTMAAWEGVGKAYSVVIRPQSGSEGTATYPFDVSIKDLRVTDPLSGESTLAEGELFASRKAGHALAPHALPGAITVSEGGSMTPSDRTPNLMAELEPEEVSKFHMYAIVKVDELPASASGYFMAYSRVQNTNELPYNQGRLGVKGSTSALDLAGRVDTAPNNSESLTVNPFYLHGSGYVCIARNYGGTADWTTVSEPVVDEMWMNGLPAYQRGAVAIASGFTPRLMSLGAQNASQKAYQGGVGTGVLGAGSQIVKCVYEPNVTRTHAEIVARFKADMATIPDLSALQSTFNTVVMFDGDSTTDFRGGPANETARVLRGPGMAFLNHARAGSYFHLSTGTDSSTHYLQTRRTEMRRRAFTSAFDLGYQKGIYVFCTGENEFNANAPMRQTDTLETGMATMLDWALTERDEINALYPGRMISVLVAMKVSHTFAEWIRDKVDDYCNALRAIYTEQVDPINAPLLYRKPGGGGWDYFIDMNAWAPRLQDGSASWANWSELAAAAYGKPNNDPDPAARIISADGQHWTQSHTTYNEGNPHTAQGVHIPCLQAIFEAEGIS